MGTMCDFMAGIVNTSETEYSVNAETIERLKFDGQGLIPAIVRDAWSGDVLTLAYMNSEALAISLKEGRTCFYSRSRGELWRKGETSGNVQRIVGITADCDYDALVVNVDRDGPACHTNKDSCFHNTLVGIKNPGEQESARLCEHEDYGEVGVNAGRGDKDGSNEPFSILGLFRLICERKAERPEGSYTTYLFDKGIEKILKKVGEESSEVIIAAMKGNREETVYEAADLCYHMLVLLCETGIEPSEIVSELARRHKK